MREIEKGSFTPLIFSATGGAGPFSDSLPEATGRAGERKA